MLDREGRVRLERHRRQRDKEETHIMDRTPCGRGDVIREFGGGGEKRTFLEERWCQIHET